MNPYNWQSHRPQVEVPRSEVSRLSEVGPEAQALRRELFIHTHSEAEFSHGICPDCLESVYAERPELRPQEPS